MRNGPDNVARAKRSVAAKKHAVARRHQGGFIHDRTVPAIELKTNVPLDPRKCVVLTNGQNYVVTRNQDLVDDRAAVDVAVVIDVVFHHVKAHAQ